VRRGHTIGFTVDDWTYWQVSIVARRIEKLEEAKREIEVRRVQAGEIIANVLT
jgi:hypothetical protein